MSSFSSIAASSSSSGAGQESKIRVRFETKYAEYRVTDAPFVLPQKLGRYGLSEVINHLLHGDDDGDEAKRQPFDFSIQGNLLRSQLKTYIASHRISVEDVLTIEYMPALSLAEDTQTTEAPAWIGCLSTNVIPRTVVAGCYDGSIQLVTGSSSGSNSNNMVNVQAHDDPIRAITCWSRGGSYFLATASKDLSLKCWSVTPSSSSSSSSSSSAKAGASATQVAALPGHINSVESVAHWGAQNVLLSGDWAGNFFGWNVEKLGSLSHESDDNAPSKKKKKTNASTSEVSVSELKAAFTLRAHSQSVSCIAVGPGARVFTCSWDHSLKEWDMERQDCVSTYVSGSKVMTSLSFNAASNCVVTSHPDGKVRLWDMRSQSSDGENHCRSVYSVSTGGQWVSQVAWHPANETVFASCDYAGIVRVWDVRATTPLGSTEAHDGKALCVGWSSQDEQNAEGSARVLSGGSDCLLASTAFG